MSHDSYELIEKVAAASQPGGLIELVNPQGQPPLVASTNQFEQEFYRQAAVSASSKNQKNGLSSSRTSSHCSLTMSPQVMKRPPTASIAAGASVEVVQQQDPMRLLQVEIQREIA